MADRLITPRRRPLDDRRLCSVRGFVVGFGVVLGGELENSCRGDDLRSGRLQDRIPAGALTPASLASATSMTPSEKGPAVTTHVDRGSNPSRAGPQARPGAHAANIR